MHLLDYPVELFRSVVETTVRELGFRESVKLRRVSRIFNAEVLRAFETLFVFDPSLRYTSPDFRARHNHEYGAAIVPFLARFLEGRPHTREAEFWRAYSSKYHPDSAPDPPAESWRLNISAFLNRILDDLNIPDNHRFEALEILCGQIDDVTAIEVNTAEGSTPGSVNHILKGFKPLIYSDYSAHLLSAAILLGEKRVYEPLLDTVTDGVDRRSIYFGTPLYAAVISGQKNLVRRLLGMVNLAREQFPFTPLEGAVKSGNLAMVEIVLGAGEVLVREDHTDIVPGFQQLSLGRGTYEPPDNATLERAFVRCARLGYTAIGRRLLDHAAARPDFGSHHLEEAMYYASLYGYIDFMQLLLEHGGDIDAPWHPVSPYPIELAAWVGDEKMVQWIMDRDSGPYLVPTVLMAIIGDDIGVLRIMLDKDGTRDNLSNDEWLTVIWHGIRLGSYRAVSYLIEEARVIDVGAEFEKNPTTLGMLLEVTATEGHPEALEILLRAGMPIDEPLCQGNMGINFTWTPMMFARASTMPRARKIEERLAAMGVERVDMLQTEAKHLFESGYYPKSCPGIESEMPEGRGVRDKPQQVARPETANAEIQINYKRAT